MEEKKSESMENWLFFYHIKCLIRCLYGVCVCVCVCAQRVLCVSLFSPPLNIFSSSNFYWFSFQPSFFNLIFFKLLFILLNSCLSRWWTFVFVWVSMCQNIWFSSILCCSASIVFYIFSELSTNFNGSFARRVWNITSFVYL